MVSKVEYSVLIAFPVILGFMGLLLWLSPVGLLVWGATVDPVPVQLPPAQLADVTNSAIRIIQNTGTTVGVFALLQFVSYLYLITKNSRAK
jgi:hypothetical protein